MADDAFAPNKARKHGLLGFTLYPLGPQLQIPLAARLRALEVGWQLDMYLKEWLLASQEELQSRKELERVREWLPVYYDPSGKGTIFGPGAPLASQSAIERAITHPGTPARAITAG